VANQVTFTYKSIHDVVLDQSGEVKPSPALPDRARLYAIRNTSNARLFYLGTAVSVKDRFAPRWEVLREMGLDQNALNVMAVWVVHIQINGVNRPPNLYGVSGKPGGVQIDVENLLIRTYVAKFGTAVRNIAKWQNFTNDTGDILNWTIENDVNVNVPDQYTGAYTLDNGENL
jgi:hypothetical protein